MTGDSLLTLLTSVLHLVAGKSPLTHRAIVPGLPGDPQGEDSWLRICTPGQLLPRGLANRPLQPGRSNTRTPSVSWTKAMMEHKVQPRLLLGPGGTRQAAAGSDSIRGLGGRLRVKHLVCKGLWLQGGIRAGCKQQSLVLRELVAC